LWFNELNEMISSKHQSNADPGSKLLRTLSNPVCLCLLLVVVTLAVYWPATSFDFVNYDDPDYFSSNAQVQTGLTSQGVIWAFSTGHAGNWHPLTWLSLMLDVNLFGKGPAGPHFTNLLFHLANTVLLFLLLRRLTAATWRSAFVAVLFALHPLHVESVAWISERKDVLSTFFGLLALFFYTRFVQYLKVGKRKSNIKTDRHPTNDYVLAFLFFTLGLMSKPMLVTLPFVMLLLDYWPLNRLSDKETKAETRSTGHHQLLIARRLVWEKIPFFSLSAISCAVTLFAQSRAMVSLATFPLGTRIANAFVSYARYLGKTFWPDDLAVLYPYPAQWPLPEVVLAAALLAGLTLAALWLVRRLPFIAIGWFWFLGTLIPVIGLVQVGIQPMANRYTYIPLIGLFIVFAWGAGELCLNARWLKTAINFMAVMVLAGCVLWTRDQLRYWQNSETLFRHTLAVTENNYNAYGNLGSWLSQQGRLQEAADCYVKSLQIHPDNFEVLYNLGNVLIKLGDLDGAIDNYRRALRLTSDSIYLLNNLGFALAEKNQFTDAIGCYEAALKLNPDYAEAHNNLATALFMLKRFNEAASHYREALRIAPNNPQIYINLGDTLLKQGQTIEAVQNYQQALRLDPNNPAIKTKLRALGVQIPN
jgi:protein O-mannosyl-transferase